MDSAVATVPRLLSVLDALDSPAAQELRGGLPRCDSTFGLGLAVFLSATADGARGWVGSDGARALDALDGGALLDELDEALAPRHRRTSDGRAWRVLSVPVMDGARARGLLCAIADGEGLQTGSGVVLQIHLGQVGAVQLVAAGEGRTLDVTLQTAGGLSSAILADMQESFAAALADAGLKGTLTVGPVAGAWLDFDGRLSADSVV